MNSLLSIPEEPLISPDELSSASPPVVPSPVVPWGRPWTGVLFLHQHFGRHKTKLLYRCIPTNSSFPPCLIPYHAPIGFFKKPVHKYVLFQYLETDFPGVASACGQLDSVLGNMDDLHAYYDYLLHSKQLFYNNTWSRQKWTPPQGGVSSSYSNHFDIPLITAMDDVFTIDSKETVDFDDALQFDILDDGETFRVSVYITCVAATLVHGFHSNDLDSNTLPSDWIYAMNSFTSNSSTVYLPHRRIPMLKDVLSKQVSLTAGGEPRLCIAVRFSYHMNTCTFIKTELELVRVRVRYNWSWSEGNLYAQPLHAFTQNLIQKSTGISIPGDSRDTVAFWMIQYNAFMTQFFHSQQSYAWYRCSPGKLTEHSTPELVHGENLYLNAACSEFKFLFDRISNVGIDGIIVPMTNPMRRAVDLFNQYCLLYYFSLPVHTQLIQYFHSLMPALNQNLRAVSKVQRDCRLLEHFHDSSLTSRLYSGVLFHKFYNEEINCFHYSIFLRDLGVYLHWKSNTSYHEGIYPFRLFYFKDALQTKQKIRVTMDLHS